MKLVLVLLLWTDHFFFQLFLSSFCKAEEFEIEERMKKINDEVDVVQKGVTRSSFIFFYWFFALLAHSMPNAFILLNWFRLLEEESSLSENLALAKNTVKEIAKEVQLFQRQHL